MRGADRAARHQRPAAPPAVSIWPRWPRKAWMRGSNGASEPRAASVDSAPVTSADWNSRSASNSAASAYAVENCVPLSSARPSFGPSASGARPASARATSRRQAATLEKDLADPDHRRGHVGERREIARRADRPLHGDDGRHAARQHRLQAAPAFPAARRRRPAPGSPSFSAIISRTIGAGVASPTPAACESTMLRCSLARSAAAMRTLASLPKPVLMP